MRSAQLPPDPLPGPATMNAPDAKPAHALLSIRRLCVDLRPAHRSPWRGRDAIRAIESFDLDLLPGESLLVTGESGSGKTTFARALAGLEQPVAGSIRLNGQELLDGTPSVQHGAWHAQVQLITQKPLAAESPHARGSTAIENHLKRSLPKLSRDERRARVATALEKMELTNVDARRRLRELPETDAFRVALACALACEPQILICDTPAASCAAPERETIRTLILQTCARERLALIVTALDARAWRAAVDRTLVIYLGRVMEQGDSTALFDEPAHPYTRALLEAEVRITTPRRGPPHAELDVGGDAPNPAHPPIGCVFHPRCPIADAACVRDVPSLRRTGHSPQHYAACLFAPLASETPRN